VIDDPQWVSPFGIVMYGSMSELALMSSAGASWVVTTFNWSGVQPTENGALNWADYDAQFLAAKLAGMDVAVLVASVPDWARGTCTNSGGCPGMNVGALARFLGLAAERYDGDGVADAPGNPVVKYWTLFAEPDYCGYYVDGTCVPRKGEDFKGLWGFHGAEYAQMLASVRQAIKAFSPRAVVTNGGLAFDYFVQRDENQPLGIYDRYFAAEVFAARGGSAMDMLAVHYYPVTMGDWIQKLNELYRTGGDGAAQAQMRSLPLISPEMGYWSTGDYSNEAMQARRLVQMFTRGQAGGVQRMAWFALFDGDPALDTESHGLFRGQDLNSPKPAYWAYRTMTTRMHGFRYQGRFYSGRDDLPPCLWDHEAYEFRRAADGARLLVAWANPGNQNPDNVSGLIVLANRLTATSHLSLSQANPNVLTSTVIEDGGAGDLDGKVDGQIWLKIGLDPVYLLLQ